MTHEKRPPIIHGLANDVTKPMRFQFVDMDTKPDYVIVYDLFAGQQKAELWHEHAKMAYLMYKTAWDRNAALADQWMDGHIMGYTFMLTFQQHYPKVEIVRGQDGNVTIRMTETDGKVTEETRTDEQFYAETKDKLGG